MVGGDCGYAFQTGVDYIIYAYKNSEGHPGELRRGAAGSVRRSVDL
jgi:hypothetical protein